MLCIPFMQLDRRLLAGVFCALSLVATQSAAQPAAPTQPTPPAATPLPAATPAPAPAPVAPESLETPYNEAAPPATPPAASGTAPAATVPAPAGAQPPPAGPTPPDIQPDTRPLDSIRARRKLALLGELGWNGLAGFGPILTFHVDPHFSLDLGAGLSFLGWKAGVRGRYNFLTSPFTPFVGVGFNATSGLGQFTSDPKNDPQGDPNREPYTLNVKASYLVQGVVGFDYLHKGGFTMLACVGYSRLLNQNNVELVAGTLTAQDRAVNNVLFKSGAVVSFAAGYAWQ